MKPSTLLAAAAVLLVPAAIAACADDPPPKAPPQPAATAPKPAGQPQVGMSDAPSSARIGDAPPAAPRPALSGQASGVYQQALQAFANGDLAAAKKHFEEATQADPRSHQAFYSLGVVQERLKDAGAAASYRQAFTLVPDYEPAIIAYAMLLAKKSQISEADRFLTEKRGQMPKSAAVAATLAEVKSLQKDTGSAQRIAQEALKINPDYRPAMVIIARDHYRNRRLDLALYALQAILDGFEPVAENPPRDKDNGEALLLRGLIWKEQNNRFGAMDMFRKAVSKRPDLVEARVQLGAALLAAGGADEALPILEGAVRYDADNLAGHLNLGDAYRLVQKYGDSKREFEWVLAHNASLPQVHYDLGLLYLYAPSIPGMTAKQQIGEAIKELNKFRELRSREEKDDSEELLNSAKIKEGELNAASAPVTPVTPVTPAAARIGGPRGGIGAPCRRDRRRPRRIGAAAPAGSAAAAPPRRARQPRRARARRRRSRIQDGSEDEDANDGGSSRGARPGLDQRGRVGAGQGKGGQAARRDHARRGHDHGPDSEADRRRRREPHRAQAHARRAEAALPRSDRAGHLQGSLLRGGCLRRARRARRPELRGARLGPGQAHRGADRERPGRAGAGAEAPADRGAPRRAAPPRGPRDLGARARRRGAGSHGRGSAGGRGQPRPLRGRA